MAGNIIDNILNNVNKGSQGEVGWGVVEERIYNNVRESIQGLIGGNGAVSSKSENGNLKVSATSQNTDPALQIHRVLGNKGHIFEMV